MHRLHSAGLGIIQHVLKNMAQVEVDEPGLSLRFILSGAQS